MSNRNEEAYSIGVDYGTNSVRAIVVDVRTGDELATSVWAYAHGEDGVLLDERDPNLARQHPADYDEGFVLTVRAAVAEAGIDPALVVGIGIDTTGSTPIPVDAHGVALGLKPDFRHDLEAMAWLWKDHTSHEEATEITARSREQGAPYVSKCGGAYSSEWYWSKALRCARINPRVAAATHSWVELADYVPALVTETALPALKRGICAAGHKAMYHPDWGGLPSAEFLDGLSPGLSRWRYSSKAVPSNRIAGLLAASYAHRVGLPVGVPVAVGAIDAHHGAVGAGVAPGTFVKIMGTSSCDCMVAPLDAALPDIPGVCGMVPESILPGMVGIEAGQSAVGDIFHWFSHRLVGMSHAELSEAASKLKPGESGLVALDWHNGNRNVLADPLLSGLIVGESLHTTPAEIYRALIEATAFGALKIIERVEEYGVRIDRVVNCGGIAEKSPLAMQVYADVCARPMLLSRSSQAPALGAAVFGAVVGGAHANVATAQRAMTGVRSDGYQPDVARAEVYRQLYGVYSQLHDAFGGVDGVEAPGSGGKLHGVMKELLSIRGRARGLA